MNRTEAQEGRTVTGTATTPPVSVIRPALRDAPFAAELALWLGEGIATHHADARDEHIRPAVVIVPEYLHGAPRTLLADLATARWSGRTVGLVGYGGRTRARYALEDARDALREAGARLVGPSLGLDVARVRASGFDVADVVLRDLVLDELAAG
ncbi:hypothetical protein [Actinomycetospora corticicola]|uniref:Alpha/beta hydrolase n=1 Tax=Actinomycetospora corticicola TaxID=663602 RepID=A0A7Y9DZZ1_9PSEU|nr:hypothetical protein [Actinomycetospora corticicola]NYD38520.1 hypothetical protein [Actinomycetospora corticicola]